MYHTVDFLSNHNHWEPLNTGDKGLEMATSDDDPHDGEDSANPNPDDVYPQPSSYILLLDNPFHPQK